MKNIFLVLHWASAAFLVLCLVVEFIVPFFLITKYVMPPEQSPGIFGYYAEDLWDEGRYPGFCVYSKKDEDGNLVVYMNQFQREAFLKDCNSTIDVARRTGVDISADYKTITVQLPLVPVVAPVVGKKALIVGGVIAYANLYVFMSPSIGTVESLPNPPGNIKEDHSIGSVITALKEKGYT